MPAPFSGQIAVTGVAQRLTTNLASATAFEIKAPRTNSKPVFIGDSTVTTGTGHQFDVGDRVQYEVSSQNGQPPYQMRPSDFYVVGTSGDVVTWLAFP